MGPFLAKNVGTSVSPWVVTIEALEPFKVANTTQEPAPFSYLRHQDSFNFDIELSVAIKPEGDEASTVCTSNFRHLYWTPKQQLTHHSITGCNVSYHPLVHFPYSSLSFLPRSRCEPVTCWLLAPSVVQPPIPMAPCWNWHGRAPNRCPSRATRRARTYRTMIPSSWRASVRATDSGSASASAKANCCQH